MRDLPEDWFLSPLVTRFGRLASIYPQSDGQVVANIEESKTGHIHACILSSKNLPLAVGMRVVLEHPREIDKLHFYHSHLLRVMVDPATQTLRIRRFIGPTHARSCTGFPLDTAPVSLGEKYFTQALGKEKKTRPSLRLV